MPAVFGLLFSYEGFLGHYKEANTSSMTSGLLHVVHFKFLSFDSVLLLVGKQNVTISYIIHVLSTSVGHHMNLNYCGSDSGSQHFSIRKQAEISSRDDKIGWVTKSQALQS